MNEPLNVIGIDMASGDDCTVNLTVEDSKIVSVETIESHYTWLEQNFYPFLRRIGVSEDVISWNQGIISSHGDKCYGYRNYWEMNNVPFHHGVALYMLTYIEPWSKKCRDTPVGWVPVNEWVVSNYPRFKSVLDMVEG